MAEKLARTLHQPSNRARPKDVKEKKVVFKGVLDSPFRIQWPSIPLNLQNAILASILQLLEGVSEYNDHRSSMNRKRKRIEKTSSNAKRRKNDRMKGNRSQNNMEISTQAVLLDSAGTERLNGAHVPSLESDEGVKEPPPLLQHLVFGINAVTKRLQDQAQNSRRPVVSSVPEISIGKPTPPLKYVFVCRADVDPSLLIDHLPHLVAAYNSTRPKDYLKLVTLPQGAELSLARALGIRRVTVLGASYLDQEGLMSMLEKIPVLSASWLSQAPSSQRHIPTHVKHLRTTAPKDMKAAKEARIQGKALAKQKQCSSRKGSQTVST